jgi:hypothetical protein
MQPEQEGLSHPTPVLPSLVLDQLSLLSDRPSTSVQLHSVVVVANGTWSQTTRRSTYAPEVESSLRKKSPPYTVAVALNPQLVAAPLPLNSVFDTEPNSAGRRPWCGPGRPRTMHTLIVHRT